LLLIDQTTRELLCLAINYCVVDSTESMAQPLGFKALANKEL
jgi:hypothetical protein